MKLYNTLTRKIEDLKPLNPPEITVYTCGPTVYDYAHIGHWFNYVRMDILIRALSVAGFRPKWVMNITDVGHLTSDADEGEDKLEKGARREGKTAWEVAEFYTKDFLDGMKQLNILDPDYLVKATDHINDQITLIQKLEAKGYAYVIDDGVYYDTSKFTGYANFARLDLDDQQAGARVSLNPQKRNPTDFALWKFSPRDHRREMEWESPWGKGFPGWHIECSAMSMKYLGETIDIHTGGIDHIPIHHTNEIAQSEAATGKRFANYWMHSNHVTVSGEKISKSLGNGIRLEDIVKRGISPEVVRLHVLESHYRSQSKFSWQSLEAAQNRLKDLQAMADLRWQLTDSAKHKHTVNFKQHISALDSELTSDLNTPQILTSLSAVSHLLMTNPVTKDQKAEFEEFLEHIDESLGLKLLGSQNISPEQKQLIAEREKARAASDWLTSDKLRDQLKKQNIELRDTEYGPIWNRS
ncbi:cysteine--tRNA ligase [Candidatus Saccharibacteria bacterium CG10_big_fil_rev_8_21_14_0_10_47_8]|nr:MAG: cysteine--tRNA ligase [Candidatus Saccharibacteria bacterium CG10_big_fil_rev_8_21_14_0_10_47_8]